MVADILVDDLLGSVLLLARLANLEVSVEAEDCRRLISIAVFVVVSHSAAAHALFATPGGALFAHCDW